MARRFEIILLLLVATMGCGSECQDDSECAAGEICVSRTCQATGGARPMTDASDVGGAVENRDARVSDGPSRPDAVSDAMTSSVTDAGASDAVGEDSDAGTDSEPDASEPDAEPDGGEQPDADLDLDAAPQDSAPLDATPSDVGDPDSGWPSSCSPAEPLPLNGAVNGGTSSASDRHTAECFPPGGRDRVFGFQVPGDLLSLEVSLENSGFDTALHLYRDSCEPTSLVACNDDEIPGRIRWSKIELEDVARGQYYAIVDGSSGDSGGYRLRVSGRVNEGEPCDPSQTFLTCTLRQTISTTCVVDPILNQYLCPFPRDCANGIDDDGDGETDEDTARCVDPPEVTCPNGGRIPLGSPTMIGTATDEDPLLYQGWTVVSAPYVTVAAPPEGNQSRIRAPIAGQYVVRFTAMDSDLEMNSCLVTFDADPCLNSYDFPGNGLDEDCNGTADDPVADTCSVAENFSATGADLAAALGICSSPTSDRPFGLMSAELFQADGVTAPDGRQVGVLTEFGPNVGPTRGPTMAVISSGTARDLDDPGQSQDESYANSGMAPTYYTDPNGGTLASTSTSVCPTGGTAINDVVTFRLRLKAPGNVSGFRFWFKFYSNEYRHWSCSSFNDFFLALLPDSEAPEIPEDRNVSFDEYGHPVSVNNALFTVCDPFTCGSGFSGQDSDSDGCPDSLYCLPNQYCGSDRGACVDGSSELVGTGMSGSAGGTTWIETRAPILPGEEFTLEFWVWDTGDHILDSTALLDGFEWLPACAGSSCGVCGDGLRDPGEVCDQADVGSVTCAALSGLPDGRPGCSPDCQSLDLTLCHACGNGSIEGPEECDGSDFGGATCSDNGFSAGSLGCVSCVIDVSGCVP
ncbi:MAG: choice-of-anchor L domain-containing protein [Deltaproteobacteria bacterium]|nr:choice-of-anchor L domain-containing protein [Deltaproteobacteria bacterium]